MEICTITFYDCIHVYLHVEQILPCPPPQHWRPTWSSSQRGFQGEGHSLKVVKLRLVRKQEVWL